PSVSGKSEHESPGGGPATGRGTGAGCFRDRTVTTDRRTVSKLIVPGQIPICAVLTTARDQLPLVGWAALHRGVLVPVRVVAVRCFVVGVCSAAQYGLGCVLPVVRSGAHQVR